MVDFLVTSWDLFWEPSRVPSMESEEILYEIICLNKRFFIYIFIWFYGDNDGMIFLEYSWVHPLVTRQWKIHH